MAKRPEKTRAVTGDNEMTDDARFRVTNDHRKHYGKLLELKKRADEAVKEYRGIIKEDLGAKGLADIKDLIALSTPEGEAAIKAEMERKARVLRWMNIPIGTQGALFGEPDRRPITERAFAEGRRDGLAGEPHDNPHHHTTEAARSYEAGFAEGQTALATNGFKLMSVDKLDMHTYDERMRTYNERLRRAREENKRRPDETGEEYECRIQMAAFPPEERAMVESIDGSDVSPSDAWMRQTREQDERRAQAAKSDAIDSLTQG